MDYVCIAMTDIFWFGALYININCCHILQYIWIQKSISRSHIGFFFPYQKICHLTYQWPICSLPTGILDCLSATPLTIHLTCLTESACFVWCMVFHYHHSLSLLSTYYSLGDIRDSSEELWIRDNTHTPTHAHSHSFLLGEKKFCPTDIMSVFSCN